MYTPKVTHVAAAAVVVAAALTPLSVASAQDPLCKQIAEAMLKQALTPHHLYVTTVAGYNGNKPRQDEMITTGDAMYLKIDGRWRRSPQTPRAMAAVQREAMSEMKDHACRKVGSDVVGGVPAVHYHVDVKDPDSPSRQEIWISADGRPLKTEVDMDVGGGAAGRSHTSTRYEYTNVSAPAGVR